MYLIFRGGEIIISLGSVILSLSAGIQRLDELCLLLREGSGSADQTDAGGNQPLGTAWRMKRVSIHFVNGKEKWPEYEDIIRMIL